MKKIISMLFATILVLGFTSSANAANINEMIFFIISSLKLNLISRIQPKKMRIYKLHLTLLVIKKALIK